MKNRIMIVFIIIFLFISCQPIGKSVMPVSTPPQVKTDENERNLPVSTPTQEKMEENTLTTLVQSIKTDKAYQYIDSLLIVQNGFMVTEEYFNNYRRDSQHTLQSVTKSFTSALIGMAIDQGVIQNVDQKILSFFPNNSSINNMDNRKTVIKLKDLLTMRSGTDYFEGEPGGESPHDELMRLMKGWDLFYLNRPMISNPGERFQYDSGGVVLMSSILKNQSGMHAGAFAAKYLFPQVNIQTDRWNTNSEGHTHTGGGLYLRPMDMAKFGLLYLKNGKWNGNQIVPEQWVRESFQMHVKFDQTPLSHIVGYGYLWWILEPDPNGSGKQFIYAAMGHMGQNIFIIPEYDMVVVFTGSVKQSDAMKAMNIPINLLYDQILPAVRLDRQAKPSYPILVEFYHKYGAEAALARYEEMQRTAGLRSDYDVGDGQVCRLAKEMERRGDTQEALALYASLSRTFTDSWQAYTGIGGVEMALDHKAEAIAAFRRSLAIKPDNPWVVDLVKGLEKNLGEQSALIGENIIPAAKETFVLPPSVLLPIPNRSQDPDAPDRAWDGETCIQMGMVYYQKEVPQKTIHSAGNPAHSGLWSNEIDTALDVIGVQYFSWDWRNQDLTQFLAWIKTNLAKGYPVLCGIKMNPTRYPEWSLDHFIMVIGYNEGGLIIDTNNTGDGRILVTYSQLASLINRYAFENQYHRYFGRAFIGVKEPVAVDASKLNRLTGRYMTGGKARIITFNGESLISHWAGENLRMLIITLSETEFRFADSDIRLRFELNGDRVVGVYRRFSDKAPEEPMQKRVEPLEDKNPEVTALVQKCIREAIEGTLKPDLFLPDLAVQIFPNEVKKAGDLIKSLGTQTGIELYERENQGSGCRYLYRLGYGDKHVILSLSLMEDKRISAVEFYLE